MAICADSYQSAPALIKLGVDVHQSAFVVAVQEGHSTPKPARRFMPEAFGPWVQTLLARGHRVLVVYEACGFGFGLQRALAAAGATCYVVAPQRLDERGERVKTDGRDATALCLRLSRYVEGNTRELAVIRVPSEEEEALRTVHRQREALVRARTKLQAQGRALLVNHSQPAPARWWRAAGWKALSAHLPAWLLERLEVFRPVLATLDAQIARLTLELEAAAPATLPLGQGKLMPPSGVTLRAGFQPVYLAPLDSPASSSPAKSATGAASTTGGRSAATPASVPANTPAAANACKAA